MKKNRQKAQEHKAAKKRRKRAAGKCKSKTRWYDLEPKQPFTPNGPFYLFGKNWF